MEVIFRTRQLQRNYENRVRAIIDWGPEVGQRYGQRIDEIRGAQSMGHLYRIPAFRLHPLHGSRAGELSIYLIGRWRLIVTMDDTAQTVIVEEVSNHYDN